MLALSDECSALAAVFCARALDDAEYDADDAGWLSTLAGASLFLAAKVAEEPRRIRDVLNAVHMVALGEALLDSHKCAPHARSPRPPP